MSEGYTADADRIGARARDFGEHAERARQVAQNLRSALESGASGAPWGGDAVGQSFAGAHAGPADRTLQQLSGLSGEFDAIGTDFTGAAETYRSTDSAAAEDAAAARRDLGGE
ncbi:MAG: hypothetical protein ACRDQB_07580 [Thermocrispum sp.]